MVKIVRKVGKKVNLNLSGVKYSEIDKNLWEIKSIFEQIKNSEEAIKNTQKNFSEKKITKEKSSKLIKIQLSNIKLLLKRLETLNFRDLDEDEVFKIIRSQISFSKDLINNYLNDLE